MTDALVEAVRSAMTSYLLENVSPDTVRVALQAIEAAGYRVVPVEATEGVVSAGIDARTLHVIHEASQTAGKLARRMGSEYVLHDQWRAVLNTHELAPIKSVKRAQLSEEKMSQPWHDIESAPTDGTDFLAAVMMIGDDGRRWWEQHVIYVDQDTGEIAQDVERGVELSEYHCWMPLPPNPGEITGGQA